MLRTGQVSRQVLINQLRLVRCFATEVPKMPGNSKEAFVLAKKLEVEERDREIKRDLEAKQLAKQQRLEANKNRVFDQVYCVNIWRVDADGTHGIPKYVKGIVLNQNYNIVTHDNQGMKAIRINDDLEIISALCGSIKINVNNLRPGISVMECCDYVYAIEVAVKDHIPIERIPAKDECTIL